jgi:Xaa-Pro aminopeptidase
MMLLAAGSAEAQPGSPAGPVPVERLAARRQALAARIGNGVAILIAAPEGDLDGRDHPQATFYRQDNDFFYLTGIESPGAWLALVARDSVLTETIIFLPPLDTLYERWWGQRLGPTSEATTITGINDVRSAAVAEADLRRVIAQTGRGGRTPTLFAKRGKAERENKFLGETVLSFPALRLEDLGASLAAMRLVKDDDEIARIRRATELSVDGHLAAWRAARPGAWERDLEADAEAAFRHGGAERLAYPSIVGSGERSTHFHMTENRGQLAGGDVVVMDMAAEYGYYKSDVTRTIPVNGRFSAKQRAVYDVVLGAQQAAIDSVKPGITLGRLTAISRDYMREHSGSACGTATCDTYFLHALSHWLGMDTHDVGAYNVPLAPGMVFTVEPGVVMAADGFRIGIEDVVLVTPNGHDVLSSRLPRAPAAIEAFFANRRPSPPVR